MPAQAIVWERIQPAHRGSHVAGLPAAAIIWNFIQPASCRGRVAGLYTKCDSCRNESAVNVVKVGLHSCGVCLWESTSCRPWCPLHRRTRLIFVILRDKLQRGFQVGSDGLKVSS
ncbi:unnamed protein product [Ectocarpus fasciculatus]